MHNSAALEGGLGPSRTVVALQASLATAIGGSVQPSQKGSSHDYSTAQFSRQTLAPVNLNFGGANETSSIAVLLS
jgi:hypothetical protein